MKKLYERLVTAAGIAILVAIFAYQVVYGSNEGSYQWGSLEGKVMNAAIMTLTAITDLALVILELNYPTV